MYEHLIFVHKANIFGHFWKHETEMAFKILRNVRNLLLVSFVVTLGIIVFFIRSPTRAIYGSEAKEACELCTLYSLLLNSGCA